MRIVGSGEGFSLGVTELTAPGIVAHHGIGRVRVANGPWRRCAPCFETVSFLGSNKALPVGLSVGARCGTVRVGVMDPGLGIA